MGLKHSVALLLLVATAAGCSSDGGSGAATGGATSASSLAGRLGCADVDTEGPGQLFTREDLSCDLSGESVNIVTFASAKAMQNYIEAASEFGGGPYVQGPDWIVTVESQGTAERVKGTLGGSIH